jgi:hypothetical protein
MDPIEGCNQSDDSCGPGLDALFQSCASITNRALSYRPLQVSSGERNQPKQSQQTQNYSHESKRDVSDTASRINKNANQASNQKRTSQRDNHQELLNECLRIQQEYLLLQRLKSSRGTAKIFNEKNENKSILRKEALMARKNQVSKALEQSKTLDLCRRQIEELHLACQKAREKNTELFDELYRKKYGCYETDHEQDSFSKNGQPTKNNTLRKENVLLKAIIADLIAGCGLDWFQDEKISQIFENVQ